MMLILKEMTHNTNFHVCTFHLLLFCYDMNSYSLRKLITGRQLCRYAPVIQPSLQLCTAVDSLHVYHLN